MNLFQKIYSIFSSYRPYLPEVIDEQLIIQQASVFFKMSETTVAQAFQVYKNFSEENGYENTLGESKTLSFEEAFLLSLAIQSLRPSNIVEIGTQYGKSTRRIIDILEMNNLKSIITCFDIVDEIKFVSHHEVVLEIHDVTFDFQEKVLDLIEPELIFLDAHPYELLKNVIYSFLEWSKNRQSILAIHDCSPGLYRSKMMIDKKTSVSSNTGLWERHVLSELFNTTNRGLDKLNTTTHRLEIFSTTHGLALISPLALFDHP